MRLEIGGRIDCSDGTFGELADVVIDPTTKRVTHLVVQATGSPGSNGSSPSSLPTPVTGRVEWSPCGRRPRRSAGSPGAGGGLRAAGRLPARRSRLGRRHRGGVALPYYPAYDVEPGPLDDSIMYDRIPKGDVEMRRASDVYSAERHHLGHVDGLIVDRDEHITHVVLQRGHLWGRREVTIPIGAVARVETDDVTLSLTKDQVARFPRWPFGAGRRRVVRRATPPLDGSSPFQDTRCRNHNRGGPR